MATTKLQLRLPCNFFPLCSAGRSILRLIWVKILVLGLPLKAAVTMAIRCWTSIGIQRLHRRCGQKRLNWKQVVDTKACQMWIPWNRPQCVDSTLWTLWTLWTHDCTDPLRWPIVQPVILRFVRRADSLNPTDRGCDWAAKDRREYSHHDFYSEGLVKIRKDS